MAGPVLLGWFISLESHTQLPWSLHFHGGWGGHSAKLAPGGDAEDLARRGTQGEGTPTNQYLCYR